jgi:hypothetical protein
VVQLELVVRAANASSAAQFGFAVSGAVPPQVASLRAVPANLGPSGGTVMVRATVSGAESCQLKLLSSPKVAVVFSHNPTTACRSGVFSARITLGPNSSPLGQLVVLALVAARGGLVASGRVGVQVAGVPGHPCHRGPGRAGYPSRQRGRGPTGRPGHPCHHLPTDAAVERRPVGEVPP